MKNTFLVTCALIMSCQAFGGTAYVIQKDSGVILMYNAPDGEDGIRSDISICDKDFNLNGCMNLNIVSKTTDNSESEIVRFKDLNSNCELTVEDIKTDYDHSQLVKIIAGEDKCSIDQDGQKMNISGQYNADNK